MPRRPTSRIVININSEVVDHERQIITSIPLDGMELGLAWISWSRKQRRCVRWRNKGICSYILIGTDRGKILPVMRGFRKIRPLTEKEKKKVENMVKQRRHLL